MVNIKDTRVLVRMDIGFLREIAPWPLLQAFISHKDPCSLGSQEISTVAHLPVSRDADAGDPDLDDAVSLAGSQRLIPSPK